MFVAVTETESTHVYKILDFYSNNESYVKLPIAYTKFLVHQDLQKTLIIINLNYLKKNK